MLYNKLSGHTFRKLLLFVGLPVVKSSFFPIPAVAVADDR